MDSNLLVDIMANEYAYDDQTVLGAGEGGASSQEEILY